MGSDLREDLDIPQAMKALETLRSLLASWLGQAVGRANQTQVEELIAAVRTVDQVLDVLWKADLLLDDLLARMSVRSLK